MNLDSSQKQRLFNLLLENYQPENKYYRYDFFFDNCATRIRDIVYKVIDGEIVYNGKTHDNRTFRSLIHEYLYNNVWIKDRITSYNVCYTKLLRIKNERLNHEYVVLTVQHPDKMPDMQPGQFVELRVDKGENTFLRRPISIHDVDFKYNTMKLLIQEIGEGVITSYSIHYTKLYDRTITV